jgi:predicted DCC family thiol-disulfide oxidoreductase YuxK
LFDHDELDFIKPKTVSIRRTYWTVYKNGKQQVFTKDRCFIQPPTGANTMKAELYYDSYCPLCNREIALLKRLVENHLRFVDIHTAKDGHDAETLPDKGVLLKRLHCRTPNGEWLIGLDANLYAWSKTPYGLIFALLRIWPIRPIADAIYSRWADRRFEKRYSCQTCSN